MPKNPHNKIITEGRVRLLSPTGKFTVNVLPSRAAALRARGFTASAEASSEGGTPPVKRADLIAQAKALGIPATGTNEALAAAIEAASAGQDD